MGGARASSSSFMSGYMRSPHSRALKYREGIGVVAWARSSGEYAVALIVKIFVAIPRCSAERAFHQDVGRRIVSKLYWSHTKITTRRVRPDQLCLREETSQGDPLPLEFIRFNDVICDLSVSIVPATVPNGAFQTAECCP